MASSCTRRQFLKLSAGGILGLYLGSQLGGFRPVAYAQIAGGTLDPADMRKFQTPVLIPPVMPKAGVIKGAANPEVDCYKISLTQFSQQILPPGMPPTTVWGYGAVASASKKGLLIHNAPSLTIEARAGTPVRVKWMNRLVGRNGNYLPHLLPVDPTLHWANPPQGAFPEYGEGKKDSRPTFGSTPGRYTGPVPMVTHLHGTTGVGDESDGYPEAWYLPAANNIPSAYATEGTWYKFFAAKARDKYGVLWGPGYATFQYPNTNLASTLWYHDHTLGITRLNVYAGAAGFFIIRGGASGDDAVLDSRFETRAVLPGPAPREGDSFPSDTSYYEIPLAIQDRSFNSDGSLFYPDSREFFDGATSRYPGFLPDSELPPIWNPEFFGNSIMVNGSTWPFLRVEQRRYRFRFLDGCLSRTLILDFGNIPGVEVWQIGSESGFLAAPVNITDLGNQLVMAPAERADVIVDFTNVTAGSYILGNLGPDQPYQGGVPGIDFSPADPGSTGQILRFSVTSSIFPDNSTPPKYLTLPAIAPLPISTRTRKVALLEATSSVWDGPSEALLGDFDESTGMPRERHWVDPVVENPGVGDTETWEMYNLTVDAHPVHVHEVAFEVVSRQPLQKDPTTDETVIPPEVIGTARLPEPWERGRKDTVICYPSEVTRIRAQFKTPGQFVWHCHIVEHEDNEMMRPYRIGPEQEGQPGNSMP